MQDPVPHVQKHALSFDCVVNKNKTASIDLVHMRQINWETFFFSDSNAMQKFDNDPLRFCEALTDPITRQRFRPGNDSPRSEYDGKHFYFWSDSSKQKFDMMPAMYSAPNLTMEQQNQKNDSL